MEKFANFELAVALFAVFGCDAGNVKTTNCVQMAVFAHEAFPTRVKILVMRQFRPILASCGTERPTSFPPLWILGSLPAFFDIHGVSRLTAIRVWLSPLTLSELGSHTMLDTVYMRTNAGVLERTRDMFIQGAAPSGNKFHIVRSTTTISGLSPSNYEQVKLQKWSRKLLYSGSRI